jgi:NAD(P)H-dependent FMN reductase
VTFSSGHNTFPIRRLQVSYSPRIIALAGSLRKGSYNKKLVNTAAAAARKAGAEVTYIDLKDYPLPIFDQDLEDEHGLPENGRRLKDLYLKNDGLLISSPEYNSSFSAVLKNTLDWLSRPVEGYPPLECFEGKVAALMAASPGRLGGIRSLSQLRLVLTNLKVLVLPEQVAVSQAHKAFDPDENLEDSKRRASVESLAEKLVTVLRKTKG